MGINRESVRMVMGLVYTDKRDGLAYGQLRYEDGDVLYKTAGHETSEEAMQEIRDFVEHMRENLPEGHSMTDLLEKDLTHDGNEYRNAEELEDDDVFEMAKNTACRPFLGCVRCDSEDYEPAPTMVVGNCTLCHTEVWMGPRQKEFQEYRDDAVVVCPTCCLLNFPNAVPGIVSLGGEGGKLKSKTKPRF